MRHSSSFSFECIASGTAYCVYQLVALDERSADGRPFDQLEQWANGEYALNDEPPLDAQRRWISTESSMLADFILDSSDIDFPFDSISRYSLPFDVVRSLSCSTMAQ